MNDPTFLPSEKTVKVSVETVLDVVKMLIDTKHDEAFRIASQGAKAFIMVDAATVNLVKAFIVANSLHTTGVDAKFSASIAGAKTDECEDYQCPHIHR